MSAKGQRESADGAARGPNARPRAPSISQPGEKPKKEQGKQRPKSEASPRLEPTDPSALSKADLKRQQRAAKAAAKAAAGEGGGSRKGRGRSGSTADSAASTAAAAGAKGKEGKGKPGAGVPMQFDDQKKVAQFAKKRIVERTSVQKQVQLFAHLPQYERETSLALKIGINNDEIHKAVLRLGLQFAAGTITGANARCVAMLTAFKEWINDYSTPPNKALSRDLASRLNTKVRFLIDCRPLSMAMGNAIRYLKTTISKIPPSLPEDRAKDYIKTAIDDYIRDRIQFADKVISGDAAKKINDGDVILTYARSHSVEMALIEAHEQKKSFRVIVVDSRPQLEGKALLKSLVARGIRCTYIHINAVSYVMKEVSKVFVGAAAMLANGTLVSRVGTGVVAMMAHHCHVPVIVCCETYKFTERVQVDSITWNELGDPDDLVATQGRESELSNWRDLQPLKLLNLLYDLTPTEFISMVITEVGIIPPTSVPVVIREYHKDMFGDTETTAE